MQTSTLIQKSESPTRIPAHADIGTYRYCQIKLAGRARKQRNKKKRGAVNFGEEPPADATVSSRKTYPGFLFPNNLIYDPGEPLRGFLMGEPTLNVGARSYFAT